MLFEVRHRTPQKRLADQDLRGEQGVVEIGSGLGTLTMRLAERVPNGKVIAIEREPDMLSVLKAELEHLDNVEIHAANAMTYDYASVAKWSGNKIVVCGNLPYQIASQLLFRFIDYRQHLSRMVVMLQREMADRLMARPGTSQYGALGVLISTWADIELVVRARASAFVPPPKVDSAVVRIVPLPGGGARAAIDDAERYRALVARRLDEPL